MIPPEVVLELHAALRRAEASHENCTLGDCGWDQGQLSIATHRLQVDYLQIIARSLVTLLATMTGPKGTE